MAPSGFSNLGTHGELTLLLQPFAQRGNTRIIRVQLRRPVQLIEGSFSLAGQKQFLRQSQMGGHVSRAGAQRIAIAADGSWGISQLGQRITKIVVSLSEVGFERNDL